MSIKNEVEKLVLSMVDDKYSTEKFRKDFYVDIQDIVSTMEEMADYVERGRYSMTDDEILAEKQHYDNRI